MAQFRYLSFLLKNETVQVNHSSSLQEKPHARWHCCSSGSDLWALQSTGTGSSVTSSPAVLRGELRGSADTEQKGMTRPDFCYAVGFIPVLVLFSLGSQPLLSHSLVLALIYHLEGALWTASLSRAAQTPPSIRHEDVLKIVGENTRPVQPIF